MIKKLKSLLSRKQKINLGIILLLLIFGMLMEAIVLLSIVPVIKIITSKQEFINLKNQFQPYLHLIENVNYDQFILLSSFFLIVVYLIKNIYLIVLTHKQNLFLANFNANLSNKIYRNLLRKNFIYYTKKNSSDIIKYFQVDLPYFNIMCQAILILIIEVFLSISVILTLIILETKASLISLLIITSSTSVYYLCIKTKLNRIGEKRSKLEKIISKIILESIQGIRDLKLNIIEKKFQNYFSESQKAKLNIRATYNTLNQIPRLFMEFIGIIAILIVIIYKINSQNSESDLFVTVGLFVSATFRLLPSLNRIVSSAQNFNYYNTSLDIIYNLYTENTSNSKKFLEEPMSVFNKNIHIKDLDFRYQGKEILYKSANILIKKGETIGIMGESGSGKSTLVDLITGLIKPTKGKVLFDGIEYENIYKIKNLISYVPQNVFLFDDTILNNITLSFDNDKIAYQALNKSLEISILVDFIKESKSGLDTIVGEKGINISGGQIKRIGIARAIYKNSEIIIMDEVTSGLDSKTEEKFLKEIKKLKGKKTIIFISHNYESLKMCDKVYEVIDNKLRILI
jgi:ATP-binding cassette, subfamily B, bacterial PglK